MRARDAGNDVAPSRLHDQVLGGQPLQHREARRAARAVSAEPAHGPVRVPVVGSDPARTVGHDEEDAVCADARSAAAESADRGELRGADVHALAPDEEVVSRAAHLREAERELAERIPVRPCRGHFALPGGLSLPDLSTAVTSYVFPDAPESKKSGSLRLSARRTLDSPSRRYTR